MSFSSEVKSELFAAAVPPAAEAAYYGALLLFGRDFSARRISLLTENPQAAEAYLAAIRFFSGVTAETEQTQGGHYRVLLEEPALTESILAEAGYSHPNTARRIRGAALSTHEQRTCFLRGAFLVCGTVADPDREYHMEFSCPSAALADDLTRLLATPDLTPTPLTPGNIRRGSSRIVYLKHSEQIADLLTALGAQENAMAVMGAKMYKEVRNTINRKVNFESANIARSIAAATRQYEAIRRIEAARGLDCLPDELRIVAEARLLNRELGAAELLRMLPEGLTVSGLNHRFRRIQKIAEALEEQG